MANYRHSPDTCECVYDFDVLDGEAFPVLVGVVAKCGPHSSVPDDQLNAVLKDEQFRKNYSIQQEVRPHFPELLPDPEAALPVAEEAIAQFARQSGEPTMGWSFDASRVLLLSLSKPVSATVKAMLLALLDARWPGRVLLL